jgi:sulfite exporter TauE/SafE
LAAGGTRAKFVLGLGLGFLPCGMVYAALLKAMSTGSAWSGAASMAAFGAGTAVSLVGLGLFSAAIRSWFRGRSPRVAAACVVALGLLVLWRGFVTPSHPSTSEKPGACHVHSAS